MKIRDTKMETILLTWLKKKQTRKYLSEHLWKSLFYLVQSTHKIWTLEFSQSEVQK